MSFRGRGPPEQGEGPAQEGRNILELDYPELGKYAEGLVERNLRYVSMTRMRRLHQEIARLRDVSMEDRRLEECRKLLPRLRYLLAYTYGRLEGRERANFREYMGALKKTIDGILQSRDPQKLREGVEKLYIFSEAIVAYHKYYEAGG
jgi:CRISPR type III-A-associated protein Csm2